MSIGPLPADVERFIRDNIRSVEELEILLLLFSNTSKEWTAAEVSQHLYRQINSVSAHLDSLRQRAFLMAIASSPPRYCFNSATTQYETIRNLDKAYKERKDTVIRLIFEAPSDNLRAFSNAFKFRRQD